MTFKLRDYQEEDIKRLRASLQINNSVIYNLPTGGGKTASTSYMLHSLAKQGKRGWFICHRKELLEQASAAFTKQGIEHGLIGGKNKFNPEEKIQVCSVLSLLNKMDDLPYPDFVIWDECHHVAARSWHKIHERVKDAKHLGLSATPIRLDGKGLDVYFNDIVRGLSMRELISQGYLSKYKIYAPSIPDLTRLGKIKGEFSDKQYNIIVNSSFIFGDVMKHWNNYAKDKRTLIFCANISHSKKIAEDFCKAGIKAAHLDSDCSDIERSKIIADFESGKLQVLTNVDLISEGFDLPAIECVVLLRPTMSLGLYLQQVGRALRTMPGKTEAIILDHSGNSIRHGLPDQDRYWNLEGKVIIQNESTTRGRVCDGCKEVIIYTRKICICGHEIKFNSQEITYLDGVLKGIDINTIYARINDIKNNTIVNDAGCLIYRSPIKHKNKITCRPPTMKYKGKSYQINRVIYEYNFGYIPKNYRITQSCNCYDCINPAHLECLSPKKMSARIDKEVWQDNAKRLLQAVRTTAKEKQLANSNPGRKNVYIWKEGQEKILFRSFVEAANFIGVTPAALYGAEKRACKSKDYNIQRMDNF